MLNDALNFEFYSANDIIRALEFLIFYFLGLVLPNIYHLGHAY